MEWGFIANYDRLYRDTSHKPVSGHFGFADHFPIIPSFVTITSGYPIVLN